MSLFRQWYHAGASQREGSALGQREQCLASVDLIVFGFRIRGAAMSTPAGYAERLTKRFGAVTVFDALDLRVEHGEVFGYLGRTGGRSPRPGCYRFCAASRAMSWPPIPVPRIEIVP